ncbi:MAG TPA: flagellar hook-length control protein FliK [Terriglobia bacterium]|nr:flagellar hook-length control protein FliK [Terriglobia bacterium]
MDISAIQSDLTRLSVLRIDGTEALSLALGQEFTARVLRIETEGQLLLNVGGKQFYAKTQLPLQEGQEIRLQVMQPGPPIELRLIENQVEPNLKEFGLAALLMALRQSAQPGQSVDPGRFLAEIQRWVNERGGVLNTAQSGQLEKLLLPLAVTSGSDEIQLSLRNVLENSGLFFEAKLRALLETLRDPSDLSWKDFSNDLKTLLGQISKALEKAELFSSSADRNLISQQKTLISEQLLSRQVEVAWQWMKDGSFVAELPLLFFSEPASARLRFFGKSTKGTGRTSRTPFTIDVYLSLPHLGKMEAWAQWIDRQIAVRLYVESPEMQQVFTSQLADLREGLTMAGFDKSDLEVKVDPVRLYRANWEDRGIPVQEGQVLDIKA